MKQIFKKNIPLFVILLISILCFVVLAFLAYREWSKVKTYQAKLIELRENIKKLNEERPYPVRENLTNIQTDIRLLTEKINAINRFFGKPYENALNLFVNSLLKTEDENKRNEFIAAARTYIKSNFKKTELPEKLLMDFLNQKYTEEEIKNAKAIFIEAVKQKSVEQVNDMNVNGIILEALGFNRTLSSDACKVYMQNIESALIDFARSPKFGSVISIDEKGSVFKVYDEDKLPPVDFIPNIIKHYKLLDDLLFRLKASGITSLKSLQKLNGLEGTKDGQYLVFSYKIEFSGSSDAIRNFLENLQKAYQDHRIYIVRWLSLKKAIDEVKSKAEQLPSTTTKISQTPSTDPSGEEKSVPPSTSLLLGLNDLINAEMRFDYIIFIGDEQRLR